MFATIDSLLNSKNLPWEQGRTRSFSSSTKSSRQMAQVSYGSPLRNLAIGIFFSDEFGSRCRLSLT